MKKASIAEVGTNLSAYVKATEKGPVIVTRSGKPIAILSAIEDEEELERLMMANSPRLQAIFAAAQKRMDAGKGIPEKEFWGRVERKRQRKKQGTRIKKPA